MFFREKEGWFLRSFGEIRDIKRRVFGCIPLGRRSVLARENHALEHTGSLVVVLDEELNLATRHEGVAYTFLPRDTKRTLF